MLKLLPVKQDQSTDTETSRQNYCNAVQIFTLTVFSKYDPNSTTAQYCSIEIVF
jgi:hypothetical protein